MKSWKVLLCFGLLLLPALLVDPHRLADFLFPVGIQSLSWDPVELGELSPGETRLAKLEVHNDSRRMIQLTSIKSDCGCVVVQSAPRTLPSRSSRTIEFSLRAPGTPGMFRQSMAFGAANFPGLAWQVDITGRVEAEIWAEPARLDVKLAPGETTEALVAIRHKESYRLGKIKSSSQEVQIIDSWPIENGRMVKLAINESPQGHENNSAILQVFAQQESGSPSLEIPIHRLPRTVITFLPERLDLGVIDIRESAPAILHRTVIVTLAADRDSSPPTIESLVPWVQVELEPVTPSTYELGLKCDVKKMSTTINEPIIRMTLPSGESEELTAQGNLTLR